MGAPRSTGAGLGRRITVAQRPEQRSPKPLVGGSSPPRGARGAELHPSTSRRDPALREWPLAQRQSHTLLTCPIEVRILGGQLIANTPPGTPGSSGSTRAGAIDNTPASEGDRLDIGGRAGPWPSSVKRDGAGEA